MTGRRIGEAFAARQQQIVRRRRRRSKRSHRGTPPKIYEDGKYYTDREQADDDVDLYTGQCKSHQGQEESPEEDIASSAGDIASSAGDTASSAGATLTHRTLAGATLAHRTLAGGNGSIRGWLQRPTRGNGQDTEVDGSMELTRAHKISRPPRYKGRSLAGRPAIQPITDLLLKFGKHCSVRQ